MQYAGILLILSAVFGVCYLVDRGITGAGKGENRRASGNTVRLKKRYAVAGIALAALGIGSVAAGQTKSLWIMTVAGAILLLLGSFLVIYYLLFSIIYDANTFTLTSMGQGKAVYRFQDIRYQRLYTASGAMIVELTMADGRSIQLQSGMDGIQEFLNHAFAAWVQQKGLNREDCTFYDPDTYSWFPTKED